MTSGLKDNFVTLCISLVSSRPGLYSRLCGCSCPASFWKIRETLKKWCYFFKNRVTSGIVKSIGYAMLNIT